MTRNLFFVIFFLLRLPGIVVAGTSPLPELEAVDYSPDTRLGVKEQLLFAPVHPALSLDIRDARDLYPRVNVTLGGDLCGVQGTESSSREVQRRPHYLSVELASVRNGPLMTSQAGHSPWLLLLLPLLLLRFEGFRRRGSA